MILDNDQGASGMDDPEKRQKARLCPEHIWPLRIASYEADESSRLKLSSQLKLQQEAGERHLAQCGLSYNAMAEMGFVFVLTKTAARIIRAPRFGEEIRLRTWHRNHKGIQFFRCYSFLTPEGETLIDSISAFTIIDPETHKILRPGIFLDVCEAGEVVPGNRCPEPARLSLPENMPVAGARRIRYSDVDYNGHLNNTVYADFIGDFMPGGMKDKKITGFSLNFIKEAFWDEEIEIRAAAAENTVCFEGVKNAGRCFEASCTFI